MIQYQSYIVHNIEIVYYRNISLDSEKRDKGFHKLGFLAGP